MEVATFSHPVMGFTDLVDALAGLTFGEPQSTARTRLDTFDARLHAAGLQLEVVHGATRHLVLTEPGMIPATIEIESVPSLPADLPAGPLGARVEAAIGIRALVQLLTLDDHTATATECDEAGDVTVTVVIHRESASSDGTTHPAIIEVLPAPGHDKPAARVCHELLQLGCMRHTGSFSDFALRRNGIDPAGYSSSPSVPLEPAAPAIDGFRDVLWNLADSIDANWQGTVDDVDSEFLHELRVAVRRTRSVLGLGHGVLADTVRSTFGKEFKRLASATGPTRDLDVYALEWPRYIADMSAANVDALQRVLQHVESHRHVARANLTAVLRSDRNNQLMTRWREVLRTLGVNGTNEASDIEADGAHHALTPLARIVAHRFNEAHRTVITNGRAIDADSPAEDLHELRKDAKKLRYLVECFATVMPKRLRKSFVRQLKGLQDNLGEHQDAEVHAVELGVIAHELEDEYSTVTTLLALGQLTERLQQSQHAARLEFAQRFAEYDSPRTERIVADLIDVLESA